MHLNLSIFSRHGKPIVCQVYLSVSNPSAVCAITAANNRSKQLGKGQFEEVQVTNYDRQIVEPGDCVASSVDYSTVPAPASRLTDARLLRRGRPRLKARAVAESKFNHHAAQAAELYT